MTYNYLELAEAEEDYTGINRANLVTEEEHDFTEPEKRFFAPDLGQFYINDNFRIVDSVSGRSLVRGTDYKVDYFSQRVFKHSSLDNGYLIYVLNESIKGVRLTYQAVGGLYTDPAYLISVMMDKYPEGIGPVIYWKNILFKPDQFVPAGHRHHAQEVYALSPLNDALERVRGTMAESDRVKFKSFYDNTTLRFEELMTQINNGFNGLLDNFQQTRKGLELQQGDFVYTDSNEDQALLRRYGKWKRHTGTILAAGGPNNAGTSMSVGAGYTNPVRQTNLFQRIDDPWGEHGEIEEPTIILQPSKLTFNEGETITIDVAAVNVEPGTMLTGKFIGLAADNVEDGRLTWQVTLDAFGRGQFTLVTLPNGRTTGNIDVIIMPDQFATSAVTVTMIDTSLTPVYNLYYSSDAQGLNPITRVNEGSVMYMNLVVRNPIINEELSMNYSAGSAGQDDFVTTLPATLTVPSTGIIRVRLEVKNDERAEGNEVFVAVLLPKGSIDLNLAKARAEIIIEDTSYQAEFNSVFSTDPGGENRISEVNEGQTFYMYATTSLPNGTTVNFEYGGTMQPDDYLERPMSAVVAGGKVIAAITTRADARTDGDKILGLTIKRTNGIALANMSLIVRDTSLAPEATIYFASTNGGTEHVDMFNEGDTIFITINTRNVENGTFIDLSYAMDGAANQAEINKEFTQPLPTRVPVTNNRVVIPATILEDYKADQNRNFRCILDMSGVSASCIIRDTSVPMVTAKFSASNTGSGQITEANEGQTIYLVVESLGFDVGTNLTLTYTGTATDADFTQPRPKSVQVNDAGIAILPMTILNDYTSEGIETMIVGVRYGITNVASTQIDIRDTSLTPALDILLSLSSTVQNAVTKINEGVTAYVHMNWGNLPVGSVIDWSVLNITTTANDFDKSNGSVTTTTITGTGNDSITTRLDRLTEGDETFKLTARVVLPEGKVVTAESATITLLDTSKTESFTVGYSSDALGNNMITRVNEGTAAYLIVRGTNIPDGSTFKLSLPSTGSGFANDADVDPPVTGTILTMNSNFHAHRLNIVADRTSEGDETLIIRVTKEDTNIPRDASIVIVDTSTTANVTTSIYLANGTKPSGNNFREGDSGYIEVSWLNGTVGDRIRPVLIAGTGNAVAADFDTSEFGTEKVVASATGSLKWNFKIKEDRTTDGDKAFAVDVTNLTTATNLPLDGVYRILDTSKTTTYTKSGWAATVGGASIASSNEGTTVYLQTTPVDGMIGDIYRLDITGGTGVINHDYEVGNASNIIYDTQGMVVAWSFKLIADRITDGNKTINAKITNVTTNQTVGTYAITILDTSQTTTSALGYWTARTGGSAMTSVNEGAVTYFRFNPINGLNGDIWRVSIDPTSTANSADISDFQPLLVTDTGQARTDFVTPISVTLDESTEGPETLVLLVEVKQVGETAWKTIGKSSIVLNDTSLTPTFDIYYSNNSTGTDRVTSIGEGTTVYLIVKTTNVSTGTILQVNFSGSSVDKDDFTTSPPYEFPENVDDQVPVTIQANGIGFYRFDIKADLKPG